MKLKLRARRTMSHVLSGLFIAGVSQVAHAQMGSGWTQFFPTGILDVQSSGNHTHYPESMTSLKVDGVEYTRSGTLETFKLVSNESNRIERRHDEHYTSGSRQMQGDVKISDISSQSIHQIFYGTTGPEIMIKGYTSNGGELRKQGGSVVIASQINNVWVRYNCINVVGSAMEVYINGSRKWNGGSKIGGGGYNNKYGLYGTKVTAAPVVQWRDVKHFRDGQTGGNGNNGGLFEAESLTVSSTSGDSRSTNTDGGSGGAYVQLFSNAVGDQITFTLPNIAPGAYTVQIGYKKYNNRGIVQTLVGPAGGTLGNLGSTIDQYSSSSSFTSTTLSGTWNIGTLGNKSVQFKVTGKNSSSSSYNIAIDYIRLTPQ